MFVYCSLWKLGLVWFFSSPLSSANKPYCLPFEVIVCWRYFSYSRSPRKLHYSLFKTLEMTRLAPYLKCLRYSVKYWLLLKICLLLPRHINIWCGWTTSGYAFNASKHARNNKISHESNHILEKKKNFVFINLFLWYILKGFVIIIITNKNFFFFPKQSINSSNSHLIINSNLDNIKWQCISPP